MKGISIGFVASLALAGAATFSVPATAGDSLKDGPLASGFSWTGFYFGAHVGGTWSDTKVTDLDGYNGPPAFRHDDSQVFGGVQMGVNKQVGNIVTGIEVDLGYLGLDSSAQYPEYRNDPSRVGDSIASIKGGFYGTLTSRLGVAFDRVLVYGKSGLAFADLKASYVDPNPTGITLVSGTKESGLEFGWTIGGGAEYAFANNWTAKVEYLYLNFNTIHQTAMDEFNRVRRFDHELDLHTVKAGLNYKF